MLKRPKRRVAIRIDMTPMVDIAFLLLIFYMATTQFKPPEKKQIHLPASHSKINLPDKNVIKITVTKEDSIFVEYVLDVQERLPSGEMQRVPTRIYEETNTTNVALKINEVRVRLMQAGVLQPFVVIKADKDSQYGTMESVMNSMKSNNLNRFQLLTEFIEEVTT